MNSKNQQLTPWGVFGIALLIITFIVLGFIWLNWTHERDIQRLKWMEEHPAEVNQWLRDHNGGL